MAPRHHVVLAVFAGGAVGGLARAALAESWAHPPAHWPWPTFVANLVAALLLGWWATRVMRSEDVDPRARPFLATGICGGLSTFSTLQVELVRMLQADCFGLAAGYAAATLAAGVVAFLAGRAAARALHGRGAA